MTYAEQFEQAEKEDRVKTATAGIFKLDATTPTVIGKVIGVEKKTFAGLGKPTKVAVLDTDEGQCLVLAGMLVTNFCEKPENVGKLIKITWTGKVHEGEKGEYNNYELMIAE